MALPEEVADAGSGRGGSFVKRMYWPRIIGLGLGFVMIGASLQQAGAPQWAWVVLLLNGFVWPHVAYIWAMRSDSPYHAEHRNLLLDSASGGFWLFGIGFNVVPSVLMLTMLSMDNVAVGGMRFLIRGVVAKAIGALVGWMLFGAHLQLESSLYVIVASIPFMVTYPLFIGAVSYRLSQQLSQQKRQFKALSQRDSVSGLATRGYWESRVYQEFNRAQRHHRPATLLLADIDHFKRVNDTYGHLLGDTVIRTVGGLLDAQTRSVDFAGRYGGDEFGLILPETPVKQAIELAQRIQAALAQTDVSENLGFSVTLSIGIAELSAEVTSPDEWMSCADRALYEAKSSGRNCIRVFRGDIANRMSA